MKQNSYPRATVLLSVSLLFVACAAPERQLTGQSEPNKAASTDKPPGHVGAARDQSADLDQAPAQGQAVATDAAAPALAPAPPTVNAEPRTSEAEARPRVPKEMKKPQPSMPMRIGGPARLNGQAFDAAAPAPSRAVSRGEAPPSYEANRERYGKIDDNPVKVVAEEPVSTFSIDVDTGSYANVRRMLTHGQLPPNDAVRVEEMINYFPYHYALPRDDKPFAVHIALAPAPWNAERTLLRVALKGQDTAKQQLPPANLVFLVDVSGSMHAPDKLPLLQSCLKLLTKQLRPQDRISLVTYAGDTSVVLSGASGSDTEKITGAIERLQAGGSTAGAAGIELAYAQAREHFIKGGINRILLATDGDFNVGITDFDQLKHLVEEKRKTGVSFTTLGFGTGNYNEHLMEQLADAGDGAYSYIDSLLEGKKVLVNEMTSTLATIAKDVKIQVEFNPAHVAEYRLIGYENRMLKREDFNNDKIDAGEIGAGHTVTALYELTLTGHKGAVEPLRYGTPQKDEPPSVSVNAKSEELAFIKLRYKKPDSASSTLIEYPISRLALKKLDETDDDFRLATAVAGFGQLLRGTSNLGDWNYKAAQTLASQVARSGQNDDEYGYRAELVKLIDLANTLADAR